MDAYLGEVKLLAFDWAPKGWAHCNGQILPIAQNQALFSLLGTVYGGNGITTFALPDMRGRAPVHMGHGQGRIPRQIGESAGQENHTLIQSELPLHNHVMGVSSQPGTGTSPIGAFYAAQRGGYAESGNVAFGSGAVGMAGGSQPHNNMPPYLALNFCICLQGLFPPRN
jgi:microcystin-dependent protein